MNKTIAIAIAIFALGFPQSATAWEGMCRVLEDDRGGRISKLESNICEEAELEACEPGLGYARGAQLGEHTWLTRIAMQNAGLGLEWQEGPIVFQAPRPGVQPSLQNGYYTAGENFRGTELKSLEPSDAGRMYAWTRRELTIPEVSEIADGSSSFSEYILGNEHCLTPNIRSATLAQLNRCHTFEGHLSAINSTHWPPLALEMYKLYHRTALNIADRCKKMKAALPLGADHVHGYMLDLAKSCEREAFAHQSYASHFLQDAWSSGHMFVRWGPPSHGATPAEQFRETIPAMITGIIHGTKSVTHNDDQMCMPGPRRPGKLDEVVLWRNGVGPLNAGGGDLYLRSCEERKNNAEYGSVTQGSELTIQRQRMITCLAHGFREVYDAAQMAPDQSFQFGPDTYEIAPRDPRYSESGECWNQRVTNRSMMLGLGVTKFGIVLQAEDYAAPEFLTRFGLDYGAIEAEDLRRLGVSEEVFDQEALRLRYVLGRLSMIYSARAEEAADGTSLAQMVIDDRRANAPPDEELRKIFGRYRSGEPIVDWNGAHVEAIKKDEVPFFEKNDLTSWESSARMDAECSIDADCQAGELCDPSIVDGDGVVSRCIRHEAPLLRAFRAAETVHWCTHDTWDELNAARRACKEGQGPDACDACVAMVLPRLRNACDGGMQGFPPSQRTRLGSICDHYQQSALTLHPDPVHAYVHVPFEPKDGEDLWAATVRAAREACLAGPERLPPTINYNFDSEPPATAQTAGLVGNSYRFAAMCGRADDSTHWHRFRWPGGQGDGTIHINLRPSTYNLGGGGTEPAYPYTAPVEEISLAVFRGPRCDVSSDLLMEGVPADSDGDGVADTLRIPWAVYDQTPEEVCIRITAKTTTVRSGYTVVISADPLF